MGRLGCILSLALLLLFSSCSSTQYGWRNYDGRLYKYYEKKDQDKFKASLEKIIRKGENDNRVPPGIYAEYGYLLYESQQYDSSIIYFEKERDRWPESAVFMQKMIRNAQDNAAKSSQGLRNLVFEHHRETS